MRKYLVVLETKKGLMDVELVGSNAKAAKTRARWSLIHARKFGDIEEVTVKGLGLSLPLAELAATSLLDVFTPDGDAATVSELSEEGELFESAAAEVNGVHDHNTWYPLSMLEPSDELLALYESE